MANESIIPYFGKGNGYLSGLDRLGWPIQYPAQINMELNHASEYDKWASAAATTITTLKPPMYSTGK
jgi:hypothetical protein